MGSKGSKSKSYSTPLAPWVARSHLDLISEAQDIAYNQPYEPYEVERLAGFTDEEMAGFEARRGLYEGGDPYTDFAGSSLEYGRGLTDQFNPNIQSDYAARNFDFGTFDQAAADQYMSPYMSSVIDYQTDAIRDDFARQKIRSDAQRVASGARGGYREAVANYMGDVEQAKAIGEATARGQQRAFENAQQQFERDRAAGIRAAQMGDASAVRAAQMGMEAAQRTQQNLQNQQRLAAQYAQTASGIGAQGLKNEMERIRAMEQAGMTQRRREQQYLDLAVQDFERQRDYPKTQLEWLAPFIYGQQGNIAGTRTTSQVAPASIPEQLLGAGIGWNAIQNLLQ
tara:strand:- start:1372 stop:2391 length:1020 start_codon:yes stop_codon:yes gene_type:complete